MKKLIFDFDGTLVDSMPTWANKMFYVLQKRCIAYPDHLINTITPLGDVGAAQYFIHHLGAKASVQELVADMDEYALGQYTHNIAAKDGVAHALFALKSQGYSLNVLTASPHKMLDVCLRRLRLFDLFDHVWSCEDFSLTKADEKIYFEVAHMLSAPIGECVLFDDNLNALQTAKNAGMAVVGVFDQSSSSRVGVIQKITQQFVYNLSQLKLPL